jgi:hypothetical protein
MPNRNKFPQFPLRVNPQLIAKIRYIGAENSRSANKEIEYIISQRIKAYEVENGEITQDDIDRFLNSLE